MVVLCEPDGGHIAMCQTGLDEFADDRPYVVQDFVRWQQSPRSEGYIRRLSIHEERFGAVT
jgi:hypothetical protein